MCRYHSQQRAREDSIAGVLASVCSGTLSTLRAVSRRNYVRNRSLAFTCVLLEHGLKSVKNILQLKPTHETCKIQLFMLRVLNAEYDQLMVMARMNVGALRCHVHLRRRRTGFSTMVGEQPWSNHPLVDLLDRTQQFIGPKGANDSSRSFAECLQRFGLGCIASQANVCCRNHSIGN